MLRITSSTRVTWPRRSCIDSPDSLASRKPRPALSTEAWLMDLISFAATAARCASERTSAATTAKPRTLLACPGGFHRGVERKQVRLERDVLDHAGDVGGFARAAVDHFHHALQLRHARGGRVRDARGLAGYRHGFAAALGILSYGGSEFLHAGSGMLERGGLLLGPGGQVGSLAGGLARGNGDGLRALANLLHHREQVALHEVDACLDTLDAIVMVRALRGPLSKVAGRDALDAAPHVAHAAAHRRRQRDEHVEAEHERAHALVGEKLEAQVRHDEEGASEGRAAEDADAIGNGQGGREDLFHSGFACPRLKHRGGARNRYVIYSRSHTTGERMDP